MILFETNGHVAATITAHARAGLWRSMFIQVRDTPNENSLMFLPGRTVLKTGTAQFNSINDAKSSPLARFEDSVLAF